VPEKEPGSRTLVTFCPSVDLNQMRVSTRGDYASRALLSLALHGDATTPTSVRDLAERTGLPQPYLEQILLNLKGVGLVRSKRGVGGGYVLAKAIEAITLAEIVAAVDGPIVAGDFGEPHKDGACDHEGQCVLLGVWADVGNHMREHLSSFTLADMVDQAKGLKPAKRTLHDL
jgi:Rrf2 family transcriptional regulator, iron-sulfur cluster assembly transcription factor